MATNSKRAFSWMAQHLKRERLTKNEFDNQGDTVKDEFLSRSIERRSWYNLSSGIRKLYGIDSTKSAPFPKACQKYNEHSDPELDEIFSSIQPANEFIRTNFDANQNYNENENSVERIESFQSNYMKIII